MYYKEVLKAIFSIIIGLIGFAFVIFAFYQLYVKYYDVFIIVAAYVFGCGFVRVSNWLLEKK